MHPNRSQETQQSPDALEEDAITKTPPPTASAASMADEEAVETKDMEASAESIPAAQPDISASSPEAKAEARQSESLVGDVSPVSPAVSPAGSPDMEDEVADEAMVEAVVQPEPSVPEPSELPRLDDGFRAGLRLLHTDELRRACLDRGLDFEGKKGTLLNRLLEHFSRAPLPTPTQECGNLAKPPPKVMEAQSSNQTSKTSKTSASVQSKGLPKPLPSMAPALAPAIAKKPEVTETEPAQPAVKSVPQIPVEIQQLRPLHSTVKAPVLRTLLSRPRTSSTVAPSFTALWRTMCPAQQTEAPKSGEGWELDIFSSELWILIYFCIFVLSGQDGFI